MEKRAALFVTVVVAFASCAVSAEADFTLNFEDAAVYSDDFTEGMEMALVDSFLQESEGMKPRTVEVAVPKSAATAPEPTIAALMPKHLKLATQMYQDDNGGQMPDEQGKLEVNRLAVNSAASEINEAKEAAAALYQAQKKLRKLRKAVSRDRSAIKQVESNQNYAAKKAFQAADRKVKYLKSKEMSRHEDAQEQLLKMRKTEKTVTHAIGDGHQVDEAIIDAKGRYLEANDALKVSDQKLYKAKTILAKAKHVTTNTKRAVLRKKQFLDNVESHKAKAMLDYRSQTQLSSYEKGDARKVGLVLSKLTGKRDAVFKYVKSLEAKTQRDVAAAKASIMKAKEDYSTAKASRAHYQALIKKFGKKEKEAVKFEKDSRMGVIDGIDEKNINNALIAAVNYNKEGHSIGKWARRQKSAEMNAEQQKEMEQVAETDLMRAKKVETAANKQQYMVDQKKITMRRQLEKIEYLKKQVKKHTASAENAKVAARRALDKANNMEKDAILARDEAKSRQRFVKVIDIPVAKKMLKSASNEVNRDQMFENDERQELHSLDRAKRHESLKVKTAKRMERSETANLNVKMLKARFAKKLLNKAESSRDAILAANNEKMKIIKQRLADAEANFAKAASAPQTEAALADLGEDLDGNAIEGPKKKKADTTGASNAAIDADTDPDLVEELE